MGGSSCVLGVHPSEPSLTRGGSELQPLMDEQPPARPRFVFSQQCRENNYQPGKENLWTSTFSLFHVFIFWILFCYSRWILNATPLQKETSFHPAFEDRPPGGESSIDLICLISTWHLKSTLIILIIGKPRTNSDYAPNPVKHGLEACH